MKNCKHCGHPLSDIPCRGCNGFGYHWEAAGDGEGGLIPVDCADCSGTKRELVCTRLSCPGDERLPATAREAAMMRQVVRQVKAG